MREIIKVFKALADKNRIRMVKALMVRPLCVCELQKLLGASQPSVSHHLKILAEAGIVDYERNGQWVTYRIKEVKKGDPIEEILSCFRGLFNDDEIIKKDRYIIEKLDKLDICYEENEND